MLLQADNVSVDYGTREKKRALHSVNLSIAQGEIVGLVGESGSGKSTLGRAIASLVPTSEGSILLNGKPIPKLRGGTKSEIQMIFQDPSTSLNPQRTVGSQVQDGVRTGGSGFNADYWVEKVSMKPEDLRKYPHQFSGGQKQRLAIARALAAQPSLLIADEPVSALDASTQASVALLFKEFQENGVGVLFVSHDLSIVKIIADHVVVLYQGRVVESGPTSLVWNDPLHPYTKSLLNAVPHITRKKQLPAPVDAQTTQQWSSHLDEAINR